MRGQALLVVGAVLAMAEGAVSVEPAGGAEKATTAKLEASEPRAVGTWKGREQARRLLQGEASHDVIVSRHCRE